MRLILSVLYLFFSLAIFAQVNQVDSKGQKQGKWEKLYKGSKVFRYRGQFKNDKPVGKFSYFYESSKVKAVIKYDENSNRSVAYFYHENGALMSHGIFKNLKKDSIWLNFGPSQRISNTETYSMDSLNGLKTIYYVPEDLSDKSQHISEKYYYKNGLLHGDFVAYYMSGTVMEEGKYENNKKVGYWKKYHPNGKRRSLAHYKKGLKHGWAITYDSNMKRIGKQYYYYGRILSGDELDKKLKEFERLGIDPNE